MYFFLKLNLCYLLGFFFYLFNFVLIIVVNWFVGVFLILNNFWEWEYILKLLGFVFCKICIVLFVKFVIIKLKCFFGI